MEARITLSYNSERDAETVAKAVSPDNVTVPPGLSVKTFRRQHRVITMVTCERRLETLIATIDDLLTAVQVAERAISVKQKLSPNFMLSLKEPQASPE